MPLTALAIYWALALLYVGGSRLLARQVLVLRPRESERVAIFGAGEAGARLASSLYAGRDFLPVAFVDDNRSLWGSVIHGVEVYSPDQLADLVKIYDIRRVLLALPSVNHRRRREILASLEPLALHVQTVPDIGDIVVGHARVEDIREVDASDLLGREPVPPDPRLFDACIRNKVVMVTGAGGSIGSELCRQIARLGPRRMVLFEMSELALYNIDRELRHIVERRGPRGGDHRAARQRASQVPRARDHPGLRRADRLPRRGLQARADRRSRTSSRASTTT